MSINTLRLLVVSAFTLTVLALSAGVALASGDDGGFGLLEDLTVEADSISPEVGVVVCGNAVAILDAESTAGCGATTNPSPPSHGPKGPGEESDLGEETDDPDDSADHDSPARDDSTERRDADRGRDNGTPSAWGPKWQEEGSLPSFPSPDSARWLLASGRSSPLSSGRCFRASPGSSLQSEAMTWGGSRHRGGQVSRAAALTRDISSKPSENVS